MKWASTMLLFFFYYYLFLLIVLSDLFPLFMLLEMGIFHLPHGLIQGDFPLFWIYSDSCTDQNVIFFFSFLVKVLRAVNFVCCTLIQFLPQELTGLYKKTKNR